MEKREGEVDPQKFKANALAGWEGEGGALSPVSASSDILDERDLRVTTRLGAAVRSERKQLPTGTSSE